MKRYTLLTADMDGTVLNTRKEITPRTARAIHRALAEGWEILFATSATAEPPSRTCAQGGTSAPSPSTRIP